MGEVCDLFDYWMDEPPTHVILAWRYLSPKKKPTIDEPETLQNFSELQGMIGRPSPMPDHLKEMISWAEEQKTLMQSGKR